jgi:hypothetical protein
VAHWIKINYERNVYLVDLDRLSAFACAPNGRITFWLPDSGTPIIINQQSNHDGYYKVLKYIQNLSEYSLATSWFKIIYDRSEYIVNLNTVSSFCCSVGKLKFWLPDSSIPIILSKNSDPDNYEKLLDYIQRQTGHTLSC